MKKYYVLLVVAIACEVFGTNMMKASMGFTRPVETALFLVAYLASFICLTFTLKGLQLGVAYGSWSGVGVTATALIGVLVWNDPMNWLIVLGIILVIGGVVLLETSSHNPSSTKKLSNDHNGTPQA